MKPERHIQRVLSEYVQREGEEGDMAAEGVSHDGPSRPGMQQTCAPQVQVIAQPIGWLKTIIAAAVALALGSAGVALYMAQYATAEQVRASIDSHSASDGHPTLSRGLRDVQDRLIRIETTQTTMSGQQQQISDKLDRLIQSQVIPAWISGVPTVTRPSVP